MTSLSKSRILYHRQCPKRLWLHVNRPELAQNEGGATSVRLADGSQVSEIARSLVALGILIDAEDSHQALADTARALAGRRWIDKVVDAGDLHMS